MQAGSGGNRGFLELNLFKVKRGRKSKKGGVRVHSGGSDTSRGEFTHRPELTPKQKTQPPESKPSRGSN